MSAPRQLRDVEWVRREYLVRKREPAQIAARLHCSIDQVTAALKRFKFELREAPAETKAEPTVPDTDFLSESQVATPSGRCRCEGRSLYDEEGICCKCGR